MSTSRYPFNDNTREQTQIVPKNTRTRPGLLPETFPVNPIGAGQRKDYTQKSISNYIFDLSSTFTQRKLDIEGTVFWVSSSDQTAFVRVQIDGGALGNVSNLGIPCRNGFRLSGVRFNQLLITNPTSQAGLTIEISVTRDYPDERVDVDL